jgi:serine protease inhibitor
MGIDIAFHYPEADFGPMGSRMFYISDVFHKTGLEVDEGAILFAGVIEDP